MSVMSQNDGKMEGWLYLMRLNRLGMQYSRKMYFILHGNFLRSFKSEGTSEIQEPLRSAIIDCCIRVTDNGKETVSRKVFFSFTLYNSSNPSDQLKLGASSPEEAAKWIRALQEAALKELSNPAKNFAACSSGSPLRLVGSRSPLRSSVDWTFCSLANTEAMTNDVIAPSPWKIFGSQNGLRLFKEAKDWDSRGRQWDDHPAIMAVGVVDGTSEAIFRTLLCLGPSRSEWDFCIFRGTVVENIDGHTDIIHQQLYSDWLPWGMKRRDLLLRRYWRREEDGTYVILYHSVSHKKCPPKRGYVRACLKSGGYVISPVNRGKQSLVRHMLAIDWKFWKFWKLYLHPSSARSITIRMLERIAALRELHGTRAGNCSREFVSEELSRHIGIAHSGNEITKTESNSMEETKRVEEVNLMEDDAEKPDRASLKGMHESVDEFFDVPEPTDYDQFENEWPSEFIEEKTPTNTHQPRMSNSSRLVKKIHQLRAQKKGCMDLPEVAKEDCMSCSYGSTLQKDPNCATPSSWGAADPSSFLIRGPNYLRDNQKIKAKGSLMQLVGVDWLRCDERIDNLSSRFGGIVQKYADRGGPEFFFVVNIQIPGTTMSTLAFYYMLNTPLDENPLLHSFVNGDDAYRNSRFKLIPYISQGSWIVKQSVGKKACLVGQALEVHYFRGKNYFELMIDVGSSMVARGVSNLVLGYLNNLVIEIAFLIQANTEEELPEVLLGTCRLNHLDASKAVQVKS